jgi:tetratricopeptide (TPR) repeat protein
LYSRIVDNDRALNNRGGLPSAFINLGDMEFLCGRTERAIAIAREGLELVESQRQFGAAIIVSTRLCAYFVAEGRIAEAFEIARQAMQKRRELVTDMTAARLLDHLAVAYASDGDREKAAILSGFTHAIYTIHGYAREQTETVSWKRLERELAELPPAERAALEARGAALSFQDALALALP